MTILAQDGEYRLVELPAMGKYPAMWRSESNYGGMSVGTTYFTEAAARADYETALEQAKGGGNMTIQTCPGWGEPARVDQDGAYCPVCEGRVRTVRLLQGGLVPKHYAPVDTDAALERAKGIA